MAEIGGAETGQQMDLGPAKAEARVIQEQWVPVARGFVEKMMEKVPELKQAEAILTGETAITDVASQLMDIAAKAQPERHEKSMTVMDALNDLEAHLGDERLVSRIDAQMANSFQKASKSAQAAGMSEMAAVGEAVGDAAKLFKVDDIKGKSLLFAVAAARVEDPTSRGEPLSVPLEFSGEQLAASGNRQITHDEKALLSRGG